MIRVTASNKSARSDRTRCFLKSVELVLSLSPIVGQLLHILVSSNTGGASKLMRQSPKIGVQNSHIGVPLKLSHLPTERVSFVIITHTILQMISLTLADKKGAQRCLRVRQDAWPSLTSARI